jgi:hypothetical protein
MYGIPDDIDWSFLTGKPLEQVAIGIADVQLHFFKDVTVSIQSDFDHFSKGKRLSAAPELSKKATTLVSLLGSSINAVTTEARKTLILVFSNGDMLRVYDSSDHYESFNITYPGGDMIIV